MKRFIPFCLLLFLCFGCSKDDDTYPFTSFIGTWEGTVAKKGDPIQYRFIAKIPSKLTLESGPYFECEILPEYTNYGVSISKDNLRQGLMVFHLEDINPDSNIYVAIELGPQNKGQIPIKIESYKGLLCEQFSGSLTHISKSFD